MEKINRDYKQRTFQDVQTVTYLLEIIKPTLLIELMLLLIILTDGYRWHVHDCLSTGVTLFLNLSFHLTR